MIALTDLMPLQDRDTEASRLENSQYKKTGSLEDLADSLENLGQLNPLIVRWDDGLKKYRVLAGNRRYWAARKAKLPALRCRKYEGPEAALEHVIAFVENANRREESPWTLALKLAAAEKAGISRKQLEAFCGKSKGTISDLIYATRMPEEYRQRLEKGENLFKVVQERRQAQREAEKARRLVTEQPTVADENDREPLPGPVPLSENDQEQERNDFPSDDQQQTSPATTNHSEPPPYRHEYYCFSFGELTIVVGGAKKKEPPTNNVLLALKRAYEAIESKQRTEGGSK
jgi:ParB/RepB/Spo0J family partition protein